MRSGRAWQQLRGNSSKQLPRRLRGSPLPQRRRPAVGAAASASTGSRLLWPVCTARARPRSGHWQMQACCRSMERCRVRATGWQTGHLCRAQACLGTGAVAYRRFQARRVLRGLLGLALKAGHTALPRTVHQRRCQGSRGGACRPRDKGRTLQACFNTSSAHSSGTGVLSPSLSEGAPSDALGDSRRNEPEGDECEAGATAWGTGGGEDGWRSSGAMRPTTPRATCLLSISRSHQNVACRIPRLSVSTSAASQSRLSFASAES